MKDLNSPFKMEHFGYKHIGCNQFSDPFHQKAKKIFCAPKLGVQLVWVGGLHGGVGSGLTRKRPSWTLLCLCTTLKILSHEGCLAGMTGGKCMGARVTNV